LALKRPSIEDTTITATHSPRFRIAASTYLNSAPLTWSFLYGSKRDSVDFFEAVPSRCAQLLASNEVDAALVPVIEYQRASNVSLVPDVCVGSRREVLSVVLVSQNSELENIRSVALDESSRTSATLLKIIFREFLEVEPSWTIYNPNLKEMLAANDAALIIGDPGMTFPREGLKVWDMAGLWQRYTGLGFVFAMWMANDLHAEGARRIDFAAARDEGLASRPAIIDHYTTSLGLSSEIVKRYLHENICFSIDEELRRGLELYFLLAEKHGLIPEVKPLKTL
jgi:chorismate dehydratase